IRTFCLWPSASKPGASTPSTRKSSPFLPSRSSSPTMRRASCVTGVFWVSIVFSYLQALIDRRERHNIGIITLFMLPTLDCEQRGGGAGEKRISLAPLLPCSSACSHAPLLVFRRRLPVWRCATRSCPRRRL